MKATEPESRHPRGQSGNAFENFIDERFLTQKEEAQSSSQVRLHECSSKSICQGWSKEDARKDQDGQEVNAREGEDDREETFRPNQPDTDSMSEQLHERAGG